MDSGWFFHEFPGFWWFYMDFSCFFKGFEGFEGFERAGFLLRRFQMRIVASGRLLSSQRRDSYPQPR